MPMKIGFKTPRIRFPAAWIRAKIRAIRPKITPEFVKETCLLAGFFMFLRGSGLIWFGLPGKVGAK
jgi:hypothetical protein